MSFEIQEDPTKSTAGLTSAIQLVDFTNGITFSDKNYTSRTNKPIEIKLLKPDIERQRFKETLMRSITKNFNILKELSKY